MKLTKSEQVAYKWLCQFYDKNTIRKLNGSPDFVIENKEYEVKELSDSDSISVTDNQIYLFSKTNPNMILTRNGLVVEVMRWLELKKKYNINLQDRLFLSIKKEYGPLIKKILEHRPHLKNRAGVIERSLDYYLDDIIRVDTKKK